MGIFFLGCGDRSPSTGTNEGAALPLETRNQLSDPSLESDDESPTPPPIGWRYQHPKEGRSLADLIDLSDEGPSELDPWPVGRPDMPEINVDDVAALGIRRIESDHLILFTDLPSSDEIDALPSLFDQAFDQWCDYFSIDAEAHVEWRLTGYLIHKVDTFRRAGLFPDDLPNFLHGYQRGWEMWLYEQPSDYYRRHLLLHEGTHGIMYTLLGSAGPPWYMEGVAELLATHRLQEEQLVLNVFPDNKAEVPYWGRVKIVRDAIRANQAMTLESILAYDARAHRRLQPYGWCWAASVFFQQHPLSREAFASLPKRVTTPDFNEHFHGALEEEWEKLREDWQLFVLHIDYGYDIQRAAVDYREGEPLPPTGREVIVQVDRGWQSSALFLEEGVTYEITASGSYQVAEQPRPWISEPGGVTLRYVDGRPLGLLLGAVRDGVSPSGTITPLANGQTLGLSSTLTPETSGTLYLRINDSPAELDDNAGQLTVHIERVP